MALITTIAGIPLFTTIEEALAWARANGLTGYHTHNYQGQAGYMGGATHADATRGQTPVNIPQPTIFTPQVQQTTPPPPPPPQYSSGGGSGGGY